MKKFMTTSVGIVFSERMVQVNDKKGFGALNKLILTGGLSSLLLLSGCSLMPNQGKDPVGLAQAEPAAEAILAHGSKSFRRSVYASTGVGASRLNPDNSQIPTWNVSDKVNGGGQVTVGADINRHVSLELHSADLGSAGVEKFGGSLRGRINYHLHGGSVLWYAGKNRHRNKRRGITGYGRAGIAMMDNSPVGNAPYEQRNSTQLLVGAGLEYATKIGLGLRAEVISYDSDAQYGQLGVIYRLGRKSRPANLAIIDAINEEVVERVVTPQPTVAAAVAPLDSDSDGVLDGKDQCPTTAPDVLVDAVGCAIFDGVLEGVNFYSASERLTPEARNILDGVAATLKQYPRARIKVNAHTDNKGSEFYNQNLSTRRAKMVVQYLSLKGINRDNLVPTAFGETNPIATNNTAKGRAKNRRVELQLVK